MFDDLINKMKRALGFLPPPSVCSGGVHGELAQKLDALLADLRGVECKGQPLKDFDDGRLTRFASSNGVAAVAGDVSQGKSTVVNALIGRNLLPHDDGEVSGVVCELMSGGGTEAAYIVKADNSREALPVNAQALEAAVAKPIGGGTLPDHRRVLVQLAHWPLPPRLVLLDMPGEDKEAGRGMSLRVTKEADVVARVFKVTWDPDSGDKGAGADPGHDERLLDAIRALQAEKADSGVLLVVNGFIAPVDAGRETVIREWRDFRDRGFPKVKARLEEKLGRPLTHIVPIAAHAALEWPDDAEDFGLAGLRKCLSILSDPESIVWRARRCDDAARVLKRLEKQLQDIRMAQSDWEGKVAKREQIIEDRRRWEEETRRRVSHSVNSWINMSQSKLRAQIEEEKLSVRNDTISRSSDIVSTNFSMRAKKLADVDISLIHGLSDRKSAVLRNDLENALYPPRQRIVVPDMPNAFMGIVGAVIDGKNPRDVARQTLLDQLDSATRSVNAYWERAKGICVSLVSRNLIGPWDAPAEIGPAPSNRTAAELYRLMERVSDLGSTMKSAARHLKAGGASDT